MRSNSSSQDKLTNAEPSAGPAASQVSIELYWIPVGAGGWFVKLNGRIWEAMHALWQRRRPLDLYHTALVVRVPEGRYVVENCWPIPDADGPARGVLVEGSVGSRRLRRWRVFRYEVRCWPEGVIADAGRSGGQPPAPERRSGDGASSAGPGWRRAQPGLGPR